MFATAKYTAIKDQVGFTFSFPFRLTDTIAVYKDGFRLAESTYSVADGLVVLQFPCDGGEEVIIKRITPFDKREVDFTDASVLRESDLDASATQLFQRIQELEDRVKELEGV
jgi:hypothetical protein